MKKTGQLLREAREARGISLQEISVHLKINSRILRALEEGDQAQLPAKTFLRGFVQSYAQFLRLNGDEVLELFQAEMGTTHPKMITKQVEAAAAVEPAKPSYYAPTVTTLSADTATTPSAKPAPPTESKSQSAPEIKREETLQRTAVPTLSVDQKTWSHSMKVGTIVVIIAIAGIIFGVIKTIEKYEREAQVVQPPPLELQAVPRTEVVPLISPLSTMVPPEGAEALGTDVPTPNLPSEAVPPDAQAAVPVPSTSPAPAPVVVAPVPSTVPATEAAEARPQEVIIEALDRVVVEYSIDDKPKATLVLNPEKVHTFRGDKRVSLGFSDGGSINLIYNGKDKGVPGNLGKPLKLSFPQ
jgi:cytoskeleton protein RodZ